MTCDTVVSLLRMGRRDGRKNMTTTYGGHKMIAGTYKKADAQLQGRCKIQRKVANNTYLIRRGDDIALVLHATDVVTLHPDGSVTLNSGGWHTVTTKDRIGQYHRVSARQGVWYMQDGTLFYDGVTIDPDGNVLSPRPVTDYELRLKRLKKQIKEYCKEFAVNTKDIALPGSGDCWGCAFQSNDPTHREEPMGISHYFDHFEEKHFVPSLLGNAIRSKGYGNPGFIYHLVQTGTWGDTYSMLYKFLLKQLQPSLDREMELV